MVYRGFDWEKATHAKVSRAFGFHQTVPLCEALEDSPAVVFTLPGEGSTVATCYALACARLPQIKHGPIEVPV